MIRGLAALLAGLLFCAGALAAEAKYDDPWSPATEQAANAAVAVLGANTAHNVVPKIDEITGQTHAIVALTSGVSGGAQGVGGGAQGVGGGAHEIKATVKELEAAKRDLGAKESDIEVRVELPADVLFDFDKADIRADAAQALAQLATVIRAYTGPVRLEGHTDGKGAADYNQKLSERRAESVKAWLVQRENIPAARMTSQGFGKTKPVASNDTDAGRQKNRRVEVVIRKH